MPAFKCPARHIWHPDVGFTAARARNLGASQATGDYLVFLDGDCVPNKAFVAQHTRLAEKGCFLEREPGAYQPTSDRTCSQWRYRSAQPSCMVLAWARLTGDSNKLFHLLRWPRRLFRVKQGFHWHGIRSCNFGVWRTDFVNVNGFDETFQGWGHEDADLVLRLTIWASIAKTVSWAPKSFTSGTARTRATRSPSTKTGCLNA
jgi:glycosyltransferase involved in cell wall biosynthesis